MSDTSNQGEPTMEEILASIRKIISEDGSEAEAPAGTAQAAAEAEQAPGEGEGVSEDVLELTERVEEEFAEPAAPVETAPQAAPAETTPADTDDAEIDAILASVTAGGDTDKKDIGTAPESSEGIVSTETERAVTSALSEFASALFEQNKDQDGPIGGNQSLDALVRAALDPYLKSWLDEHLEALVERVLREELSRMARRAENI